MKVDGKVSLIRGVNPGEPSMSTRGAALVLTPDQEPSVAQQAREFARMRIVVGNLDAVRADRVQALRGEIARGRYRPGAGRVARAVLQDVLVELLA